MGIVDDYVYRLNPDLLVGLRDAAANYWGQYYYQSMYFPEAGPSYYDDRRVRGINTDFHRWIEVATEQLTPAEYAYLDSFAR